MLRVLILVSLFGFFIMGEAAQAKLKVLTTTTNLKSLVEEIGGDRVSVTSLCRGTQDPHYLEAKPSYMMKAARTDLLVSIGLGLEVGWLPLIIRGARNPKIRDGQRGSLIVGRYIEALEKIQGEITRADGDVHPEGNPHFMLDPLMAAHLGEVVRDKLTALDGEGKDYYFQREKDFSKKIKNKLSYWSKKVPAGTKTISYHKTLTYFYDRFKVNNVAILEPKPGIPPSASHILDVMKQAKEKGVQKSLVENYFNPSVARRVAKDVAGMKVELVPVAVGGHEKVQDLFSLYDYLVQAVVK